MLNNRKIAGKIVIFIKKYLIVNICIVVFIFSLIVIQLFKSGNFENILKSSNSQDSYNDPDKGKLTKLDNGWVNYAMPTPMDGFDKYVKDGDTKFRGITEYYYKLNYPKNWNLVDYGSGYIVIYQGKPKYLGEIVDTTRIYAGVIIGRYPPPYVKDEMTPNASVTDIQLKGYKGQLRQSPKFKRYYLHLSDDLSGRYFELKLENPNDKADQVFTKVMDSLEIIETETQIFNYEFHPVL